MTRATLVVAAALLAAAAPSAAQRAPAAQRADTSPAGVVQAFYAFHFSHDMGFDRAAVRARSRWISPDLLAHIGAYFARPSDPNEVPDIDGDPFTDSQEYPRSFQVGVARTQGDTARVPVAMLWPEGDRRVVRVLLVRVSGAWRITDLRYANGEPSLRELLDKGK